MELAQLTQQFGIYDLRWPAEQVWIRINHVREVDDTVKCWIDIRLTIPEAPSRLHGPVGFNLSSTQSRQKLAEVLRKRWDAIDWDECIEQTCVIVLERFHAGEAAIDLDTSLDLSDTRPIPSATFLLEPFLLQGEPNLFFAEGGSGKSFFAIYLAVLVSLGLRDPKTGLQGQRGRVLYVDYETTRNEIETRARMVCRGLGLETPPQITYQRCRVPLPTEVERLQELVSQKGIRLVIVDSVGYSMGGEREKPEGALEHFLALRSLGVTSASLDHVAKAAPEDKTKPRSAYGSVYKYNSARSVWELRGEQDEGSNTISLGLFHRKFNNGPRSRPQGLQLTFESGGAVTFSRQDIQDVPELAQGMKLRDQIAAVLRHGAAKVEAIAAELGKEDNNIRTQLSRHKDLFVKVGDKWGLAIPPAEGNGRID